MKRNIQKLVIIVLTLVMIPMCQISAFAVDRYNYYKRIPIDQYPIELKAWYKRCRKIDLNIENPKTYNEKIQWLKLWDSTPLKTRLADKYLVRDYVKEKIGEKYLVPLLGLWDNFDDIDFDKLPNRFVLKCNHGSGWNMIVEDKSTFDKEKAKQTFDKWISKNYIYCGGYELHYSNIKPKIVAESYISGEIKDYRVLCFSGKPKCIWADFNVVDKNKHCRNIYDEKWNLQPYTVTYPNAKVNFTKPKYLDEILELSKKLSKDFSHVRVDFFEVDGKLYFSEMTFTPHNGMAKFSDDKYNRFLGDMITLPKERYDYHNIFKK